MKTKHLPFLLLPLIAAQCKKEEPTSTRPIYQIRNCTMKVNGTTWKPHEDPSCNGLKVRYRETDPFHPDGYLGEEVKRCGLELDSSLFPFSFFLSYKNIYNKEDFVDSNLIHPLFSDLYTYASYGDEYGIYDSLLTYNFTPTVFFPQDYDCSCPPDNWGRIQAIFAFDLLNRAGTDTLHITDGQMLIDFYSN